MKENSCMNSKIFERKQSSWLRKSPFSWELQQYTSKFQCNVLWDNVVELACRQQNDFLSISRLIFRPRSSFNHRTKSRDLSESDFFSFYYRWWLSTQMFDKIGGTLCKRHSSFPPFYLVQLSEAAGRGPERTPTIVFASQFSLPRRRLCLPRQLSASEKTPTPPRSASDAGLTPPAARLPPAPSAERAAAGPSQGHPWGVGGGLRRRRGGLSEVLPANPRPVGRRHLRVSAESWPGGRSGRSSAGLEVL